MLIPCPDMKGNRKKKESRYAADMIIIERSSLPLTRIRTRISRARVRLK